MTMLKITLFGVFGVMQCVCNVGSMRIQMQGFINRRGQNRQGLAPANRIIQGRGKRVFQ